MHSLRNAVFPVRLRGRSRSASYRFIRRGKEGRTASFVNGKWAMPEDGPRRAAARFFCGRVSVSPEPNFERAGRVFAGGMQAGQGCWGQWRRKVVLLFCVNGKWAMPEDGPPIGTRRDAARVVCCSSRQTRSRRRVRVPPIGRRDRRGAFYERHRRLGRRRWSGFCSSPWSRIFPLREAERL